MQFENFARTFDFDGAQILVFREGTDQDDAKVEEKNLDPHMIVGMCALDAGLTLRISLDGRPIMEGKPTIMQMFEPGNEETLREVAAGFHKEFTSLAATLAKGDEDEAEA